MAESRLAVCLRDTQCQQGSGKLCAQTVSHIRQGRSRQVIVSHESGIGIRKSGIAYGLRSSCCSWVSFATAWTWSAPRVLGRSAA